MHSPNNNNKQSQHGQVAITMTAHRLLGCRFSGYNDALPKPASDAYGSGIGIASSSSSQSHHFKSEKDHDNDNNQSTNIRQSQTTQMAKSSIAAELNRMQMNHKHTISSPIIASFV
jgi:hypothetical protein